MKRLSSPGFSDNKNAVAICTARGWVAQQPLWLANYTAYRKARGSPKSIVRTPIVPNVDDDLYSLYGSSLGKKLGNQVRHDMAVGACPICGSDHTGTADHFLPRDDYPEFSIFGPNLIPACAACNMFAKRVDYMGSGDDDFLLHPYFDKRLRKAVWQVEFVPPFPAVRFRPVPLTKLGAKLTARVRFHLSVVLKHEFKKSMEHRWPSHAEAVALEARLQGLNVVTTQFLNQETARQLRYARAGANHNSWLSAFYRGLLDDAAAQAFVAGVATTKI